MNVYRLSNWAPCRFLSNVSCNNNSNNKRGLKSVEREYKQTKIKAVVRLYRNEDPAMEVLRQFEERSEEKGRCLLYTSPSPRDA